VFAVDWTIKWLRLSDGQHQAQEQAIENNHGCSFPAHKDSKASNHYNVWKQKMYPS
jgi:hypothetical protein